MVRRVHLLYPDLGHKFYCLTLELRSNLTKLCRVWSLSLGTVYHVVVVYAENDESGPLHQEIHCPLV